ncbi:PRD domain-containing protein [Utexia brackfieldae]|uniref:BglG family transcription antiterminator LicT n=1 Tax=Utexia brackfieldae TaxID=3074108 RepID=UPI00370D0DA1
MKIIKVINNNVALAENERGKQVIIKGKGIAFKRQKGEYVDKQVVEQFFHLSDRETFARFEELLTQMPLAYLELAIEIVEQSKLVLGKKLNESIYLSLADHLYNTLTRKKEGIELKNALLWEIKRFYPDEYEIGKRALISIQQTFEMTLAEDEAGFIALHFVNAQSQDGSIDTFKMTQLMQDMSNIVRYFFNINLNEESVYYYRFITHLKFFAQRIVTEKTYNSQEDPDMIVFVQKKYPQAYACVEKMTAFLNHNYHYRLSDEERLYLTVHIQKVISQQ